MRHDRETLGSLPLAIGDVVAGKYRLERMLGEGGTGLVVLARHMTLGREVALKFLRPALATREVTMRFEREARAISQIESEYVVSVLDVGQLPDGDPFMVMERLEGQDLQRVLKEGALSLTDAVDCMVQVCEALREAHARGVIHRDLKPANLFLTRTSDGVPHVKVVDFGISKVTDPRMLGADPSDVTQASAVLGSPRYMAPEQLRSSRDVDARCDVWSVGAVLYQLLSGRVPFDGETNVQASMKVMTKEPPALSDVAPEVPLELCRVVHGCLVKELAGRWPSAAALQDALLPFASERARVLLSEHRAAGGDPNVDVAFGTAVVGDESLVPSSARPRAAPALAPPPPSVPVQWPGRGLEPTPVPVVLLPTSEPPRSRPRSSTSRRLGLGLLIGGVACACVGLGVATAVYLTRPDLGAAGAAPAGPAEREPDTVSLDAGETSP